MTYRVYFSSNAESILFVEADNDLDLQIKMSEQYRMLNERQGVELYYQAVEPLKILSEKEVVEIRKIQEENRLMEERYQNEPKPELISEGRYISDWEKYPDIMGQ